jgi:histidine ammonia-lyase
MTIVGGNPLNLNDFEAILFKGRKIELDSAGVARVRDSYEFLKHFSKNKVIYGINTGFGPMAPYKVPATKQKELQLNLIRSHCSGSGNAIPTICVKALMVARLNTLMLGYSGIHESVVYLLRDFINNDITPIVYEHGSVGASGDLVQLAHMALSLIGEGEVNYKGEVRATAEVLKEVGLEPITIHMREGLGLMNGTSAMTGIGIINVILTQNLLQYVLMASCMLNEIVGSYDDHYSDGLNDAKLHRGQREVSLLMRSLLGDSKMIRKRHEYLYERVTEEDVIKDKVQEYYSLRCVPQILGPVWDAANNAMNVLVDEVNSANDNPIIDAKRQNVFHGGNFHGDYVAYEMDKLKTGVTKISMLCERQLNFLLNDKLNHILPPFINHGKLGFNFGMQGVQFTATSTVAENQTISFPMYVHSIPNNNDNQDIVSMGTNGALMTRRVIENSYEVLAIHFMGILQAIDYLKIEGKMSSETAGYYYKFREIVAKFEQDTVRYPDIKKIKAYLLENRINLEKRD